MAINQMFFKGDEQPVFDLTQDTVTPDNLLEGITAHDSSGNIIIGRAVIPSAPSIWDGSIAESFDDGDGSEASPYQIATAAQLAYFAQQVNAGKNYSGEYFKLTVDIRLNDTSNWTSWDTVSPMNSWTPIGTKSNNFKGTFDGQGHVIIGIYTNTEDSYQGLFGCTENATIKNVGVVESYIKGGSYVGGVVGYVTGSGTVINCYNTGEVTGTGSSVGGVVGLNNMIVTNCYNTGTITSEKYVGGVVGRNNDGTVINCYNTGTVTGTNTDISSYATDGGVVGYNYNGIVEDCYYLQGTASRGLGSGGESSIGTFINPIANIKVSDDTTLTYTGTLLEVLKQWVSKNKSSYSDLGFWTDNGVSSNYPTFKY